MAQFIIRSKNFGYNDETYYVAGYRIARIFNDQAEAEQAYNQLELKYARQFPLFEYDALFDASEEEIKKYDDFVFERCGKHILKDGQISWDVLPQELNPQDTLEFIKMTDSQSFQLLSFENEATFYGIWLIGEQNWLTEQDIGGENLIYESDFEKLKTHISYIFDILGADQLTQTGTLEELSDTPNVLRELINSCENLIYQDNVLSVMNWDGEALFAVNALLKAPIFEIKTLTAEQIKTTEDNFVDEEWYE